MKYIGYLSLALLVTAPLLFIVIVLRELWNGMTRLQRRMLRVLGILFVISATGLIYNIVKYKV